MRGGIDPANWLMVGYPLAVVGAFWMWPDVTLVVFLVGAAVAVPLFLIQGGKTRTESRAAERRHGLSWFRLVLAGISFSWPFIVATTVAWWQRRHKGEAGLLDARTPDDFE